MDLLLIAVVSILVYIFYFKNKAPLNANTLPFLFLIKNKKRAHEAIREEAEKRNAKFLDIYIGLDKHVFVVHPESMKEVLKSEQVGIYQKVLTPMANSLGSESIFYQDIGDEWKKQRAVISHPFHFDNVKSYLPVLQKNTATLLDTLKDKPELQLEMSEWSVKLALENLGACIFGEELDIITGKGRLVDFVDNYEKFMLYNASPVWRMFCKILERLPTKARAEYARLIKNMTELRNLLIQAKRDELAKHPDRPSSDLITQMLAELSPASVQGNTFGLFLAGHETTARSIAWSFYFLSVYPKMQQQLHEEIDRVTGGKTFDYEQIRQMTYLDLFLKEVMRHRPSTGQFPARVATEDVTIQGHVIPKGTPIVLSIYSIQHLPEFWPKPYEFNPERFTSENSKDRHPFAYLPFSLGRRAWYIYKKRVRREIEEVDEWESGKSKKWHRKAEKVERIDGCGVEEEEEKREKRPYCIKLTVNSPGSNFAIVSSKVALIMFLQKYDVELASETIIRPGLVGCAPNRVDVRFKPRN